jgi:hypothetical protein
MAGLASITVRGATQIADRWQKVSLEADRDAYTVTRMYVGLLTTSVKAHASGHPGPRTPTGDYRRSITGETERRAGSVIGTVGTTRPQGPRLELGFHGVDSLGRHYEQPPFAHFRPALSKIEGAYAAAVGGIIHKL